MIILLRYLADLVDNPQSRGTFGEMIAKLVFDSRFFDRFILFLAIIFFVALAAICFLFVLIHNIKTGYDNI